MKKRVGRARNGEAPVKTPRKRPSFLYENGTPPSGKDSVSQTLLQNARQTIPSSAGASVLSRAQDAIRDGRVNEAKNICKDILKRDAKNFRALTLYGIVLNTQEEHALALRILKKSIKSNPLQEEAFNALGTAHRSLGNHQDSIKAYNQALKINPRFAGVMNNMGISYREAGYFDLAAEHFERALHIDPHIAEAWNGLARSRKFTTFPENLPDLISICESRATPASSRRIAWYALGKIYDDMEMYDKSFPCYANANNLRIVPATAKSSCDAMVHMSEYFGAERFNSISEFQSESDDPIPVFIVGLPRSGTTLLEQIVASHPSAVGGGELNYFTKVARNHGMGLQGSDPQTFFQFMDKISDRKIKKLRSDFFSYFEPRRNRLVRENGVVIDKTPFNFLYLGLIRFVLPEAKILHCQRDALDTGLSIFFTDFAKNQPFSTALETIGEYTSGYQRLMKHWEDVQVLPILDVPYNSLVNDQEEVTREILEFCKLPWNDQCLNFHQTSRHVSTPSDWQVRQPIYTASNGRWRNYEQFIPPLRKALDSHDQSDIELKVTANAEEYQ